MGKVQVSAQPASGPDLPAVVRERAPRSVGTNREAVVDGKRRVLQKGPRITEGAILKQIGDYLTARRAFWFRINTAAFWTAGRMFKSHNLGPGTADILVLRREGKDYWFLPPLWIECKTARGEQSPVQITFEKMVTELGHDYVIAHSIDDLAGYL